MQRRKFGREFKIEAVRPVKDHCVSVAPAARDLDVHENMLRKWFALLDKRVADVDIAWIKSWHYVTSQVNSGIGAFRCRRSIWLW
jgi:hypothetical protein